MPKRGPTKPRRRSNPPRPAFGRPRRSLSAPSKNSVLKATDNPQFREALAEVEKAKLDLVRTTSWPLPTGW